MPSRESHVAVGQKTCISREKGAADLFLTALLWTILAGQQVLCASVGTSFSEPVSAKSPVPAMPAEHVSAVSAG